MKNKSVSLVNLKVCFAYSFEIQTIQNMFTGRNKNEKVPTGRAHIFEMLKVDGRYQSSSISFCGISHDKIGDAYTENEVRPHGLPMCPECEAAWKAHPRSPWKAFVNGEGIKV